VYVYVCVYVYVFVCVYVYVSGHSVRVRTCVCVYFCACECTLCVCVCVCVFSTHSLSLFTSLCCTPILHTCVALLLAVESEIEREVQSENQSNAASKLTRPGAFIYTLLERANISASNQKQVLKLIKRALEILEENSTGLMRFGTSLMHVDSVLCTLFVHRGDGQVSSHYKVRESQSEHRVHGHSHRVVARSRSGTTNLISIIHPTHFPPN
jgi:hypothetical protein